MTVIGTVWQSNICHSSPKLKYVQDKESLTNLLEHRMQLIHLQQLLQTQSPASLCLTSSTQISVCQIGKKYETDLLWAQNVVKRYYEDMIWKQNATIFMVVFSHCYHFIITDLLQPSQFEETWVRTLKSLLRTLDLPWETPAATIAPEWIIGPSWNRYKI